MRIVKKSVMIAFLLSFGFACDSPRNVCHTRLEYNEANTCSLFLLAHAADLQRGVDDPEFANLTLYLCFLAEQRRKKCDEKPGIIWFGI